MQVSSDGLFTPIILNSDENEKDRLVIYKEYPIKPSMETWEKALAEFAQKGYNEVVLCERCRDTIHVTEKGYSVRLMDCRCGLYKDTLRGL